MTAKTFSKVLAQISALLEGLSEEEITAAAEGKADLVLVIEHKGATKRVASSKTKATKSVEPKIAPADLAATLEQCSTRGQALTTIEDSKLTGAQLREVAQALGLPPKPKSVSKAAIKAQLVAHIGQRADARVIRGY